MSTSGGQRREHVNYGWIIGSGALDRLLVAAASQFPHSSPRSCEAFNLEMRNDRM